MPEQKFFEVVQLKHGNEPKNFKVKNQRNHNSIFRQKRPERAIGALQV